MKSQRLLALLVPLVTGCAAVQIWKLSQRPVCYQIPFESEYTAYEVHATASTPFLRLGLDDPRGELDPVQVDKTALNVLDCLEKTGVPSTPEEKATSYCNVPTMMELKSCLTLKVGNWHLGCPPPQGFGQDVFPCAVPPESCEAKGQTPTTQCPCECRAITQNTPQMMGNAIIVTPQLHVFPQELAEYLTGCLYPNIGKTAPCASDAMIAPKSDGGA